MLYAILEDCLAEIPALTEDGGFRDRIQGSVQQYIYEASRQFEGELKLTQDFFAPAPDVFQLRIYLGDGTEYLPIHPNVEIEKVYRTSEDSVLDMSTGSEIKNYIYDGRYLLRGGENERNYCGGDTVWARRGRYAICAKWGFPCVPPDVTIGVKCLAMLKFISNPKNRVGLDTSEFDGQEVRLRNDYNRILRSYVGRFAYLQTGVG